MCGSGSGSIFGIRIQIVESLNGDCTYVAMSSIFNLLHLIYPIPVFTCVDPDLDPYSEYGSVSTKVLNSEYGSNLDPDLQHCFKKNLTAVLQ